MIMIHKDEYAEIYAERINDGKVKLSIKKGDNHLDFNFNFKTVEEIEQQLIKEQRRLNEVNIPKYSFIMNCLQNAGVPATIQLGSETISTGGYISNGKMVFFVEKTDKLSKTYETYDLESIKLRENEQIKRITSAINTIRAMKEFFNDR